jgi:hypothetical protein
MQNKLVSLYKYFFIIFLVCFASAARAEYYVVYTGQQCDTCSVRPPHTYYYHGCHHRYHHHYVHQRRRSSASVRVYYYYNVFPTSACQNPCGGCGPCARPACEPWQRGMVTRCRYLESRGHFVNTEQPDDYNYDMRTMDDDREY